MNELISTLNFKHILFKEKRYDQKIVVNGINHLSAYLKKHIHSTSPFVLLATYNHIKTVIAYYAILKAGKIAVLLDPETKTLEMSEIIQDIDPAAIIFMNASETGFNYNEEIIFRKQNKAFIISSDLTDVCTIAYTNAEDGYSKGAMITEKNFCTDMNLLIQTNKIKPESKTCAFLPFSHLFGLMQGVIIPTHSGGISVLEELNMLGLESTVKRLYDHRITHFYSSPSVYYILSKCEGADCLLNQVKYFYSGGAKLPEFIYNSFYKKTNHKIREGYGLTECAPAATGDCDTPEPVIGSVGKAFTGIDIKIIGDNNTNCQANEVGEIYIKGDNVFKGYFNQHKATEQVFDGHYFKTGDLGKIDADGNIYFCGLKKDMINVSGYNVYPKKLERLMHENKNVLDIRIKKQESMLQGEIVVADIKLKDNSKKAQEEYKQWCNQNLTTSIIPKFWNFE